MVDSAVEDRDIEERGKGATIMIKLALFDVGETLVHEGQALPHAVAALEAIRGFTTTAREPLALGVVSDYLMPASPVTEAKIAALERDFENILAGAGLKKFFTPTAQRITLSSRAGVNKPSRRIFELAAERSGTGAALAECLFVTEDAQHLAKCQEYGMTPVQFGAGTGAWPSFSDWTDAPGILARLVSPGDASPRAAAAAVALSARHGLVGFTPRAGSAGERTVAGQAKRLVQLTDERLGPLRGVYVELPTDVTVHFAPDGRVEDVAATPPEKDEVAEAANYVAGLVKSKQVAMRGQPPARAPYVVEEDDAGRKRLVRRGYA
jgi:hypothetical protein